MRRRAERAAALLGDGAKASLGAKTPRCRSSGRRGRRGRARPCRCWRRRQERLPVLQGRKLGRRGQAARTGSGFGLSGGGEGGGSVREHRREFGAGRRRSQEASRRVAVAWRSLGQPPCDRPCTRRQVRSGGEGCVRGWQTSASSQGRVGVSGEGTGAIGGRRGTLIRKRRPKPRRQRGHC